MAGLKRQGQPPIASGRARNLPFQVAAVCWVDLLGYGTMIGAADFNPVAPQAKTAIARLRAFHLNGHGLLKAFVVPKPDYDLAQLSAQIEQVMVTRLADYECPKSFRFGPVLPRNAMGKLEDWA